MTRRVAPKREAKPTERPCRTGLAITPAMEPCVVVDNRHAAARQLLSNLPDQLPVTREEIDLVRVCFADLITAALKDSP